MNADARLKSRIICCIENIHVPCRSHTSGTDSVCARPIGITGIEKLFYITGMQTSKYAKLTVDKTENL